MSNPWLPWNPQAAQNNQATLMNYQQMYTNQGFNPANLTPAQLQQYQQWQMQFQAWQTQYGKKYMESVTAMQQAATNPPLPPSAQPPPPPPSGGESIQNLTEVEKNFEKEYKNWEDQYEKWKKDNEGHPNQAQYKEYEAQWENMRKELNVRREELRRKIGATPSDPVPPTKLESSNNNDKKTLLPTPSSKNPDQSFPPAFSSSSVSAHKLGDRNDNKKFGRPDARGRGRGMPNRGRGDFGNSEPRMGNQNVNIDGGEGDNKNTKSGNFKFDGGFGGSGPGPNANQPWGPRGQKRPIGDQNFNSNDGPNNWNRSNDTWGQNSEETENRWSKNRDDGSKFRRGNQYPDGPPNRGPNNNFNEGPRNDQFNEEAVNRGPGNHGPNMLNQGNLGPNHFPDGPGNCGPNQFPDGPMNCAPNIPNKGPGNRRPNKFNDGPRNRGPNHFPDGPGNRGPNIPNDGPGNLASNVFHDGPGNHGPHIPNDGPGNRPPGLFQDGPGNHGPHVQNDGPRNRPPSLFHDGPGNHGPHVPNDGPGNRPSLFHDRPGNLGPNIPNDGPGNRRPGNRGPNQFPEGVNIPNEGPGNRGPKMFPEGPDHRGPNIPSDGPGNRGRPIFNDGPGNQEPFRCNEGPGNWGPNPGYNGPQNFGNNNFNDGPGNRGPPFNQGPGKQRPPFNQGPGNQRPPFNRGPGNHGPPFNQGPRFNQPGNQGPPFNQGPRNHGPNSFNQGPGQFGDGPGFGGRGNQRGNPTIRPENWQFNEGNSRNFDNPNWDEFQGGNGGHGNFNQQSHGDMLGPNNDSPNFPDGPISPTLLKKIPSLMEMPLMANPQESVAKIDPNETSQLSGFVGNILAKLGVASASPSLTVEEPKKPEENVDMNLEQNQTAEPILEPEPEPEKEIVWKPQVFDYSNMKPASPPTTELKFEVKDYGHTGTKRATFDYGHGGDRSSKTFDYGHGGDRGPRSFDYGHGGKHSYDYTRDSSSTSNEGYRPRYRSERSPPRKRERSRSRSPHKTARRDYKDSNKKGLSESRPKVSPDLKNQTALQAVLVEDLIHAPGRQSRPNNIVFILRGISGSGKSFVTRLIKEKEVEFGGAPPRILSLDDYFMVESDEEVKDSETGLKKKVMKYEYDKAMESVYQAALLKAFKKTISDGFFQFIIVDAMNKNAKEVDQMWSFAKQKGFQVYICEMDNDVATCFKRNIHNRTEKEVEEQAKDWENVSNQYLQLDVRSLLQSEAIDDVVMEDVVEDEKKPEDTGKEEQQADDEDEPSVSHFLKSKWDDFESSGLKLDLLDGLPKKRDHGKTIEEYLATEDEWPTMETTSSGKKRVRWADMEEKKQQSKIRAVGFVVGQTDWDRMMDPTDGESALTRTKYI